MYVMVVEVPSIRSTYAGVSADLIEFIWYDALLFRAFLWREHTFTVLQSHFWIYSFIAEFFSKIITVIVLHWCATYIKLFFFDCASIRSLKRTIEQNNHYSIRLHYVFYVVIYYLSINSKVSYYLVPGIVKKLHQFPQAYAADLRSAFHYF
jgi:hypothetical protein